MRSAYQMFWVITMLAAILVTGCAASSSKEVVGSKHVVTKTTDTMVVASVGIYVPFRAVVHNGSAKQIVLKGEDNLLAEVTVKETTPSNWELRAPADLAFVQHSDLEIDIPFIDMVSISFYSDGITFADKPFETKQTAAPDAGM